MIDYRAAGVDIEAGNETVRRIRSHVESTFSSAVLTGIGSFGALYDLADILKKYQHPVLVQSIDGVGTKIMLARMLNRFDTIGRDLVSATANDIVVLGATPLTLLDYIANDRLRPETVEKIVQGMAAACRENDIALVGGETAEMPGTYLPGEHDLAGVITGVVEKDRIIDGRDIVPGDYLLALPSSGLHTNGYSLARKLFFEEAKYDVTAELPELDKPLGEVLLEPHLNYTRPVRALLDNNIKIKGMAHITGGGLVENMPRILPENCSVEIDCDSWPAQPVFALMQKLGGLDHDEMHRVFNMGVGLVMVLTQNEMQRAQIILNKSYEIGRVIAGNNSMAFK